MAVESWEFIVMSRYGCLKQTFLVCVQSALSDFVWLPTVSGSRSQAVIESREVPFPSGPYFVLIIVQGAGSTNGREHL